MNAKMMLRGFLLLGVTLVFSGCAQTPRVPLATVDRVDVDRYLGTWYEIALLPNRFQSMCVSDTQATYSREDDVIRVVNRCRKDDGETTEVKGIAKVVPDSGNAKLRVSFFRPFYGDYWILALDPDYRWVLVGEQRRKYGWVLSRDPKMGEAELAAILDKAQALGFDRSGFVRTPQGGGQ